MKYRQEIDGRWFRPRRPLWLMACCDCGLVHRVKFRIVKGKIEMQVFRDNRRTGQRRRHKVVGIGIRKSA